MEMRAMGDKQMNDENDMARLGKVPVLKVCGHRVIPTLDSICI